VQNFAFKFQAVAEKTANIVRGLLYFAAPCISMTVPQYWSWYIILHCRENGIPFWYWTAQQ